MCWIPECGSSTMEPTPADSDGRERVHSSSSGDGPSVVELAASSTVESLPDPEHVSVNSCSANAGHNTCATFLWVRSFKPFEDLKANIKQYETEQYVQFWRRDLRAVEAARKQTNRPLSDKIKFYELMH